MSSLVLEGKTAIVTGASSGIGFATAHLLARDGATVLIMGRDEDALIRSRAEIMADVPGAKVEIFAGDASKEAPVRAALDRAFAIAGRLDIVVPTIGGADFKPLLMLDVETVTRDFEFNFMSMFIMVRYSAPLLREGGAIVCISSVAVTQAFWGLCAYSAAKAGLERFVKAAAFELGGAKIRINAVRPGVTLSPDKVASLGVGKMAEQVAAETPLGRIGLPEDLARTIRFLAGPESGWVTGQSFSCDGGQDQGKVPNLLDDMYGEDVMSKIRAGQTVAP